MKSIAKLFGTILFFMMILSSCSDDQLLQDDNNERSLEQQEAFLGAKRSCGHEDHMHELLADPVYQKSHELKFEKLVEELAKPELRNCSTPIIIPVAVHFQNVTGTNQSCLEQLVNTQIDVLNNDITGTNSDVSKWTSQAASFFPGISNGEACVRFCVATKNHPSGYGLTNGDLAITVNRTNGERVNNWSGYLNIYVRPNLGFLGEAPLGGSGNGDGVLIDASTFGLGSGCGNVRPQAPYNLGRTTTHEVGHYLLLDHIWGNGCGIDDGVSDTPAQASDSGGCPNLGVKSCGSNDMHMNYMDYTNDACMYMFSNGQVQRMVAYINSSLNNLKNKASSVCEEGNGGSSNPGGENPTTDNGNDDNTSSDVCARVNTSNVSTVNNTSVLINWANIANANRYRVRYRKQGTSAWTVVGAPSSQKTITGLTPNTVYEYAIRVHCDSGWTSWSRISTFSIATDDDSSCTKNEIKLELFLDDYGSETSWELVKENGALVSKGGPFRDGQNKVTKEFCLADGCYTMYIDDSFGDGICCDYGDGRVRIRDGAGRLVASSNGRFGYFTYLDFCVTNGSARLIRERKDEPKKTLARKIKKS